jgi:ketosteroid isomerase-like protein
MVDVDDPKIETIVSYFRALEAHESAEAASHFTEDVVYYHPPSYGASVVRGRADLAEYFETRGDIDVIHEVERFFSDPDHCALIGYVHGDDLVADLTDEEGLDRNYFVSYAEFEDDLISYYQVGTLW